MNLYESDTDVQLPTAAIVLWVVLAEKRKKRKLRERLICFSYFPSN